MTEKGKESVGNVKVSSGLNLFPISNCQDALSLLSLSNIKKIVLTSNLENLNKDFSFLDIRANALEQR